MTCPTCHCEIHSYPQLWEVRCTTCGEMKYPRKVERPTAYVCLVCQDEQRATRVKATRESAALSHPLLRSRPPLRRRRKRKATA